MFTIQKATIQDFSVVQKLSEELIFSDMRFDKSLVTSWPHEKEGEKYLKGRIRGRKGVCFIARDGDEVIGYATGGLLPIQKWRPLQRSELDNLYVREKYRGKGVGKQLLEAFINWSKEEKVERVMLIAIAANENALAFYAKQGFHPEQSILEMQI